MNTTYTSIPICVPLLAAALGPLACFGFPGPAGQPCEVNSDCSEAYECEDNVCTDPAEADAPGLIVVPVVSEKKLRFEFEQTMGFAYKIEAKLAPQGDEYQKLEIGITFDDAEKRLPLFMYADAEFTVTQADCNQDATCVTYGPASISSEDLSTAVIKEPIGHITNTAISSNEDSPPRIATITQTTDELATLNFYTLESGKLAPTGSVTQIPVDSDVHRSLAMRPDGDSCAVGIPESNTVKVIEINDNNTVVEWASNTHTTISPESPEQDNEFGTSIAYSPYYLAIGSPGIDSVYIYDETDLEADTPLPPATPTLTMPDIDAQTNNSCRYEDDGDDNPDFGKSLALSSMDDSPILAIGAPGYDRCDPDNTNCDCRAGAAFIYSNLNNGGWSENTGRVNHDAKNQNTETLKNNEYGEVLAISSDGTVLAITAPGDNRSDPFNANKGPSSGTPNASNSGAVYIYTLEKRPEANSGFDTTKSFVVNSGWGERTAFAKPRCGSATGDKFGASLSVGVKTRLSGDKTNSEYYVAIGSPGRASSDTGIHISGCDNEDSIDSGKVYVFRQYREATDFNYEWALHADIAPNDETGFVAGAEFGSSVALASDDSNTLVVGAPGAGAIYIH